MPDLHDTRCHELGHSLAVLLSGGTLTSVTITASAVPGEFSGETGYISVPPHRWGFVAFAGLLMQTLARTDDVPVAYRPATFRRELILALRTQKSDVAGISRNADIGGWTKQLLPWWPIVKAASGHVESGCAIRYLTAAVKAA